MINNNVSFQDKPYCLGQADIQVGLMALTVVSSILSFIPPTRFAGAIALRSIAVVSSLDICQDNWIRMDWQHRLMKCAKVAVVALGLTAVATSTPVLLMASVAADIAVQLFELIKSRNTGKAIIHGVTLIVDVLALSGLILGSWQLMVTAASVSALAMLILGIFVACHVKKESDWTDIVTSVCYFALIGTSIASAVIVSQATDTRQNYKIEKVFNSKGQLINKSVPDGPRYTIQIGGRLAKEFYPTVPITGTAIIGGERVD